MFTLSRIVTVIFDALVWPFGSHRLAALVVVSLLCGAALALLFRATSNPDRIRRARARFGARVLEMRLYPDDLLLITRALLGALVAQGAYLRAAARPLLVVTLVAVPVFFQAEARFARAPLSPGTRTLVTASLKADLDPRSVPAALTAAHGLGVEPAPLRAAATREIAWRVSVSDPGAHRANLRTYDLSYAFDITAASSCRVIGHERRADSLLDALVRPAGLPAFAPDSPLETVRVAYADAHYHVAGARVSWLTVFLVGTLVGAAIPAWRWRIAM